MINKEQFVSWKDDPVTKEFFRAIHERITDSVEALIQKDDAELRGFIKALKELSNPIWEDFE